MSTSNGVNPDCIFCKIIKKEIPASIIYEDDGVMAFLNIRPNSKGHTLIIPKAHSGDLLETPDEILAELVVKSKMIAAKIMEAVNAQGFNFTINTKPAAGQEIFHTHFHIIPRFSKEPEPASLPELAAHIKKFFQ